MYLDAGMVARVRAWMESDCIIDATVRTGSAELYLSFSASNPGAWFKQKGFAMALKAIGKDLGVVPHRTAKARMFGGIRLK